MEQLSVNRVYKVPEAARLLGVGERTYYEAARRGEVPSIRIGRRVIVPGALLERFLAGEEVRDRLGGVPNFSASGGVHNATLKKIAERQERGGLDAQAEGDSE